MSPRRHHVEDGCTGFEAVTRLGPCEPVPGLPRLGFFVSWSSMIGFKLVSWMEMNRNALAREIKRLELDAVSRSRRASKAERPAWYRALERVALRKPPSYSAVVGSITERTAETQFAGNPPISACLRTACSSGAM